MAYNDDAQVFERQIVIENTSQQAGVTSGSIVNKGTLSTLDTYITGHTIVNDVKITPNLNDIIFEQQSTLANNQASFTNITDFFFDDSAATSFKAIINVTVSAGQAKYAVWEINGLYKPSGWVITSSFTGDITGVDFSIANQEGGIGQVQYKNSNTSGTTTIRYRATTTAPPGSTPIGVSGGVITNTSGPFLANNLIYANTDKTLATTDITYNSNLFTIGGSSRLIGENATSFVNFSNGGAITSMGDASVAKRMIIGEKVGIATTAPSYALDIVGDINFTGTFYKNKSIYSGSEIWATNGTNVFYTQGNVGFGTTNPSHQLDVAGGIRSTSLSSGSISTTNIIATNSTFGGHIIPSSTLTYDLGSENNRWRTLYLSGNTIDLGGTLISASTTGNISFGETVISTTTSGGSVFKNATIDDLSSTNINTTILTAGTLVASNAIATNISTGTLQAPSGITVGNINFTGSLYQNGVPYLGSQWTSTAGNVSYTSGSVSAINIDTTTVTASTILANIITAGTISLSGDLIVGGTLTTVNITTTNLTDVNISTGTLNASSSTISNVLFTNISSSTLLSSNANITTLTAGTVVATGITSGSIIATTIVGSTSVSSGLLAATNVTATNVVATDITSGSIIATTLVGSTSVSSGLLAATNVTATNVVATGITSGSIIATTIVGSTSVSSGLLAATNVTATNIVATTLTAGALKTSDIALNGNLVATGDITAFGSLSDRRLKTNIIDIDSESALNTVKSLRPVTFDWRDDIFNESKRGSHDVGFIAQEVEEVVPQAVAEYKEMNSGTFYKNIKHERLIPYLVGAIQTLQLRIEELEKKV